MNFSYCQQWIVILTGCGSVASVAAGIWVKLRAEARMLAAQKVQSDIKLLKLFTEMMNIAHARGEQKLSEKLFEAAIKSPEALALVREKKLDLADLAVVTMPVGVAAQDAAIAAIASLGKQHQILRRAAIQGLESLSTFKPAVAKRYLDELEKL